MNNLYKISEECAQLVEQFVTEQFITLSVSEDSNVFASVQVLGAIPKQKIKVLKESNNSIAIRYAETAMLWWPDVGRKGFAPLTIYPIYIDLSIAFTQLPYSEMRKYILKVDCKQEDF